MKYILFLALIIISFLITSCSDENIDKNSISKPKKEFKFQSKKFTLVSSNNIFLDLQSTQEGIDFVDYKGKKAVLIDIFATWCQPCIDSIPKLKFLKEKYKNDLEIISVLFQDEKSSEDIEKFIKKYSINYKITVGKDNEKLANEFNVKKIPEMFLFSKEGKFITKFIGNVEKEDIEKYIGIAIKN